MVIYRTFNPTGAKCTFFLRSHRKFYRINHTLGHKTRVSKYKKIEIIQSIFSNHNGMKLKLNNRRKTGNLKRHEN